MSHRRDLLPSPSGSPQRTNAAAIIAESQLLSRYDYAWNAVQNGPRRTVTLHPRTTCLCVASGLSVRSQRLERGPFRGREGGSAHAGALTAGAAASLLVGPPNAGSVKACSVRP